VFFRYPYRQGIVKERGIGIDMIKDASLSRSAGGRFGGTEFEGCKIVPGTQDIFPGHDDSGSRRVQMRPDPVSAFGIGDEHKNRTVFREERGSPYRPGQGGIPVGEKRFERIIINMNGIKYDIVFHNPFIDTPPG
jgi:hypothetical protein